MSLESQIGNVGMEELIPVVNKLHDVFTRMGPDVQFDLPQIAVVGGQSAGKSSVLENFVGRDFLPRGSGIVTRRPLILQLINSKQEWGQFLHCKEKRFTRFEDIRKEIEADTERITGRNKGISKLPINLRIYSPHVLDITLIDLPGLTRNPIGDQPEDIETQIRDMIFEYISKETCLILAVTPANVDLGTSDALKLAKTVDPEGLRTIGVITKLDLMDAGTDAGDILQNKCLSLRRGYVGIVNRSQKDIDGKKDIKSAQEAEKTFFETHPEYKGLAHKMGTPYLQRVLNEQLTLHIRECLPALKSKLRSEHAALRKQIEDKQLDNPGFNTKELHNLIHQLQTDFRTTIRGYGNVGTSELSGGVKINYLFHEQFAADLDAQMRLDETELRRQILFAVRNSHGIEMGIFTPNMAFQTIVKGQIWRLLNPTLKCVDLVTKEFSRTVLYCVEKMNQYPTLCEETHYIISSFIEQNSQSCKSILSELLESEAAYINTKHEEFVGSTKVNAHEQDAGNSQPQSINSSSTATRSFPLSAGEVVQNLAKGYMSVLTNNILKGGVKSYWFVLTSQTLSSYKDESEAEKKFEVTIQGLSFRDEVGGNAARRIGFTLFFANGRPLNKEFTQLNISPDSPQDGDRWKTALRKAGVKFQNVSQEEHNVPNGSGTTTWHHKTDRVENNYLGTPVRAVESTDWTLHFDTKVEQQVQTIRDLVDSYMVIVKRTSRDLVPKIITNFIIKRTQDFIDGELLAQVNKQDLEILMGVGKEEIARRAAILRTYQACQESLEIINQITIATGSKVETDHHKGMKIVPAMNRLLTQNWNDTSSIQNSKLYPPVIPRRPISPDRTQNTIR